MTRPRVLVIGGGVAGASVAWHLAGDADVVVLEQGDSPGAEASSHSAGMVRRMGEDPIERVLACRTHAWLAEPGDDWPDPPSRVTGAVLATVHDPWELADAAAHLRSLGARVDRIDGDDIPALRGADIAAAWSLPDERVADPQSLVAGFLRGAQARGAQLRLRATVVRLLRTSDRVAGVELSDGARLHADAVVLAAGAWTAALAQQAGLHRPLVPLARGLLVTEACGVARSHPWCWLDDVGVYARPEAGGWLVSGCDEAVADRPHGVGSRGGVSPGQTALALHKLERYLPALRGQRIAHGWTGLRTFAPDRRPLLGPDEEAPGLHWAAGLGGFGVTCSHAVGEVVAAGLRGVALPWFDLAAVAPHRHAMSTLLVRWRAAALRCRGTCARSWPASCAAACRPMASRGCTAGRAATTSWWRSRARAAGSARPAARVG